MRNFRITFLLVGCLFVFGIYGLVHIPKQEFPEYTIRQGVVVGVYPGATSEEVEEQLAKPLEQFLMTYKEVKRSKTTSTSQNGMCYVMVELNDDVNDKDEVWSKIKHGLAAFKMQLPAGVAALVTNDDFGDTSALLITLESDTRSYRELKGYMDDLSDRLRRIESVSNLRPYGVQQEQISVYADHDRLAAYGIGEKVLSAALASQGLTPAGGSVSNGETETPIHIAPSLAGEREVAEQIVWSDPEGHVLRVKDVARVACANTTIRTAISVTTATAACSSRWRCAGDTNIVEYGREVDEVLHAFMEEELPSDVAVQRIADQAKVVGDSVHSFLRDLFVAMAIIILVMMLLFPLRSAVVAAVTIPLSTFISVGVMYLCGIPLNTVTLAALVVVLGMIVDNSIVVIDGYLDYIGRGHSRWYAAVESAREFFPSLLLATICICMIFYPILFTMTGMMRDFLTYFPWTITINLMVSLLLAVLVIPFLEIVIIPAVQPRKEGRKSVTDRVHDIYRRVLAWTFRHGWLTISLGLASVAVSLVLATQLKLRMVPFAEPRPVRRRDLPAARHPAGSDRSRRRFGLPDAAGRRAGEVRHFVRGLFVAAFPDELRSADRPGSGAMPSSSSIPPRSTIPRIALDRYADAWADRFPEAYVKFKQLDYQNVPSLEFRFYGSDIDSLRAAGDRLMDRMRRMPELMWVHSDYEDPRAVVDVRLDPVTAPQLGVARTLAAVDLALAAGDVPVGAVSGGRLQTARRTQKRRAPGRTLALRCRGHLRLLRPCPASAYPCGRSPTSGRRGARAKSCTATACAA